MSGTKKGLLLMCAAAAALICTAFAVFALNTSAYAAESFTVTYHAPKWFYLSLDGKVVETPIQETLTDDYKIPENINMAEGAASSLNIWPLDANGGVIDGNVTDVKSSYATDVAWTGRWNDKEDGSGKTYNTGDTLPNTANIDLYVTEGVKVTESPDILPMATKPGFIFDGWHAKTADGPFIGNANDEITFTKVATALEGSDIPADAWFSLVAHYTPCSYTIEFDGNGATAGSTPSMTFTYGDVVTMPASGFTRTGCTFAGWSVANDGTQPVYAVGQAVEGLLGAENGATIKMYAMWIADENTIAATADESPVAPLAIVIAASFAASAFVATRRRRQR